MRGLYNESEENPMDSRFRGNDGSGRLRSNDGVIPFPFYLTHTKAGRAVKLQALLPFISPSVDKTIYQDTVRRSSFLTK